VVGVADVLPTLVIFFRESLEASLIVGIILAYLRRVGRSDRATAVWAGVAIAVGADAVVALATYHLIQEYDGSRFQTVLEGTTYVIATVVLTYMSFWMKGQSRTLRNELEERVAAALSTGTVTAMAVLAFITVGREGLETVFFTLAIAFNATPWGLAAGAAAGLALGLLVSYWVYTLGRRLPLGLFFNGLGVLLLLFASGLLADGIQNFQALGWLPFLHQVVWNSSHLLSENSATGDLLHSFFGYAEAPTVLQISVYVSFLAVSVLAYLRLGRSASGSGSVPAARS
jgi:high-affinity iron transporter